MSYKDFISSKVQLAEKAGFEISKDQIHPWHKPHVRDVVQWGVAGGRRAYFLNFGLHKTAIQLETVIQYLDRFGGNGIITCPLAVQYEFFEDAERLGVKDRLKYITGSVEVDDYHDIYITNYERVRKKENWDPSKFTVATSDEASVLRSLDSQTTEAFNSIFRQIKYRFVATATPAPNQYLELCNYADYLGIMDRGQILTRFFKRDSTKAGNLTLYEKRETEFWYWVNSWAVIITKPSDLGHSDEGYTLPPHEIRWHEVSVRDREQQQTRSGQIMLTNEVTAGVGAEKSREERASIPARLSHANKIIAESPDDHFVLWHYREDERREIEKQIGSVKTVYGSQQETKREDHLIGFKKGTYPILATKPSIAGQGCNFQYHCHRAIFLGIDDNFNDFIQAIFRIMRFGQTERCIIDVIYTDAQQSMKSRLETKWRNHNQMQENMTAIVRKHGLNSELYMQDLKRQNFNKRIEVQGENFIAINNDNVQEMESNLELFPDESIDQIITSIPFGNHYEYSENYECFGHNSTNGEFWKQMDFLTPHLYRVLKPGRIAVIHVKDRIRYSYQTGSGFISVDPFTAESQMHFLKHGFFQMGSPITITTDVVAENNQTYRLGYSEMVKDGSKMGNGLPEFLLVFRKPPTDRSNSYADDPVKKSKDEYSLGRWQIDAHQHWKSDGERMFDREILKRMNPSQIWKAWKEWQIKNDYDYEKHVELCDILESLGQGKLSKKFMSLPPVTMNDFVWSDINRMNTLNAAQANKKLEKHICPLQIDVVERAMVRWSNPGDTILDPFAGLMTVPYVAINNERTGIGIELNKTSWTDGVKHCQIAEAKKKRQSLFDSVT